MQAGDGRKANISWERGHLTLVESLSPTLIGELEALVPRLFHASEGVRALVPGRMDSRQHAGCVYICPMTNATARR